MLLWIVMLFGIVYLKVNAQNTIRYEVPKYVVGKNEEVVKHSGYILLHSSLFNVSRWVAYQLKAEHVQGKTPARMPNRNDPNVTTVFKNSDFASNIFDRGHQAPHKHLAYSPQTILEASYFTNITPQTKELNRGVWKTLETKCTNWAKKHGTIYITTGSNVKKYDRRLNKKVSIPKLYYKVILVNNENDKKAIGYVIPNDTVLSCLCSYAVTVDSVEKLTSLDFFHRVNNDYEEQIESEIDEKFWGLCNSKCRKKSIKEGKSK
jgi:endonuclease G